MKWILALMMVAGPVWADTVISGHRITSDTLPLLTATIEKKREGEFSLNNILIKYTEYYDYMAPREDCLDFTKLDMGGKKIDICGGAFVWGMIVGDEPLIFVTHMGGSGGGWGLYRVNPKTAKVDYFGDTKEIFVQNFGDSVLLHVAGRKPQFWRWDNNKDKPVKN